MRILLLWLSTWITICFGAPELVPAQWHHATKYWDLEGGQDIIVIPSFSFDPNQMSKVRGISVHEERLLYNLFYLKHPETRVVYVTSMPVGDAILQYYLKLISGLMHGEDPRARLLMLSMYDDSNRGLAEKMLERPSILSEITHFIQPTKSVMSVFRGTETERALSERLEVSLYSSKPNDLVWGTKSGSRTVFRDLNIPHPDGTYEPDRDVASLTAKILNVLWRNQQSKMGLIKLEDSFSGYGNAYLDVSEVTQLMQTASEFADIEQQATLLLYQSYERLKPVCCVDSSGSFMEQISQIGAIFELFITTTPATTNPSGQGVISPDGRVEILSTHDQIIDGQIYQGCLFPASDGYREMLMKYTERVGEYLAAVGVVDYFGVDFMCNPSEGTSAGWECAALEINLRKTGTTHPLMTMHLLTGGTLDGQSGRYLLPDGQPRAYVSYNQVRHTSFHKLTPYDLLHLMDFSPLHYDHSTKKGVVFNMLGSMTRFSQIGMTCIGEDLAEAASACRGMKKLLIRAANSQ